MDEHFVMWVKTYCPFCVKAKDAAFDQKVSYTVYIMDDKLEELNGLKEKWNHSTVPIIIARKNDEEQLVGGYTEFAKLFRTNND
jgi:glutaredoxin